MRQRYRRIVDHAIFSCFPKNFPYGLLFSKTHDNVKVGQSSLFRGTKSASIEKQASFERNVHDVRVKRIHQKSAGCVTRHRDRSGPLLFSRNHAV